MRLAGQEKAGYFPTPATLIDPIRAWLTYYQPDEETPLRLEYRVLDPCAGEGAALYNLVKPLQGRVIPYGIELDQGRAEYLGIKRLSFGHGLDLTGDAFDTTVQPESMALLYLNPPYDLAVEEKGIRRQRLELHFLKDFTPALYPAGGVLVYVVPQSILRNIPTVRFLATNYENFNLVRFDDANSIFKQVVIYATRKEQPDFDNDTARRLAALGDVEWAYLPDITATPVPDGTPYWLMSGDCSGPILFRHNALEPEEVAERAAPIHLAHMATSRQQIGRLAIRTATPPRAGHVAMLIAAGSTNGTLLQVDDPEWLIDTSQEGDEETLNAEFVGGEVETFVGPADDSAEEEQAFLEYVAMRDALHMSGMIEAIAQLTAEFIKANPNRRQAISSGNDPASKPVIPQIPAILKGRTYKAKEIIYEEEDVSTENETKTVTRTRRVDVIKSEVVLLDGKGNANTVTPGAIPAFLDRHMPALVEELNRRMQPYYDFSTLNGFERSIRGLNPHRRIPNTDKKGLMVAQMHATAAAATVLEHEDSSVIVGEMGTGKTLMGTGVAAALRGKGKFTRGVVICPPHLVAKWAEEIKLTWPRCYVMLIKTPRHIEELYDHPGPVLGIVKNTTLSLGPGWEHAFDYVGPATLKTRADKKDFVFTRKPKPWILAGKDEEVAKFTLTATSKKKIGERQASAVRSYRNRRGIRCPSCGGKQERNLYDFRNKRLFCQHCGAALFHFTRDVRRWPLSRVFKRAAKRYGPLDLVVADEVHQCAPC